MHGFFFVVLHDRTWSGGGNRGKELVGGAKDGGKWRTMNAYVPKRHLTSKKKGISHILSSLGFRG